MTALVHLISRCTRKKNVPSGIKYSVKYERKIKRITFPLCGVRCGRAGKRKVSSYTLVLSPFFLRVFILVLKSCPLFYFPCFRV